MKRGDPARDAGDEDEDAEAVAAMDAGDDEPLEEEVPEEEQPHVRAAAARAKRRAVFRIGMFSCVGKI